MDYNYHTHTVYCAHATGSMEEYVVRSIENGIRYLGFAEHTPLRYPDGHESWFRLPMTEIADYFQEANHLREKYKKQIEIHAGFEMEYFPEYFDQMLAVAKEAGAEYLILGQHYLEPEYPDGVHVWEKTYELTRLQDYVKRVVAAMDTGVFSYIAHPDMCYFIGDNLRYREEMRKLCIAARKKNIPLELNLLGIREERNYPREEFWKVAGEEQAPVTFGLDSHRAEDVYDEKSLAVAKKMVQKYDLNYIGKPELNLL